MFDPNYIPGSSLASRDQQQLKLQQLGPHRLLNTRLEQL